MKSHVLVHMDNCTKGPIINYGEVGGGNQSLTPTKMGWMGKVLAILKGGTTSFEVSLSHAEREVHTFSPSKREGGGQHVLPSHFVAPPPSP